MELLRRIRGFKKDHQRQKNHLKQRGIEFCEGWVRQNQANIDKLRSQLVGSTKFALSDFVHNGKIDLNFSEEDKKEKINYSAFDILKPITLALNIYRYILNYSIDRNVELAKESFSNRPIISLSQMKSGNASPFLHNMVIEVSKKKFTSNLVSRWAVEHPYNESSFQRRNN